MAQLRRDAKSLRQKANMPSLDVMTITRQCLFSEAWNATDDFFEEPQSGLVHKLLGIKDNGMQVYDRCGQLVGEIKLFPKIPDMKHEWTTIRKAFGVKRCNVQTDSTGYPAQGNSPK
ncbi:uncharacterized protein [Montipora capricornis]|uniref:uncharacterized protein n=1 Tax=Montipora capricornis TaxID=246305 RepID=UPI0035F194F8